jgi:hypothetical protein
MTDRPKPPVEPDEDPDPLEEIQVQNIDPTLAVIAALATEGGN